MELKQAMRIGFLMLFIAAATAAASAQTPANPSAPKKTAAPAVTATHSTSHAAASSTAIKLPPGIPPVNAVVQTAFVLRYQDITIGAGAEAQPNKMYKVMYTGWLAADGKKFDSSYDHPGPPLKDKDGKPVLDDDGKPKRDVPQPMPFPQGYGRLIPGFDQGFIGMKIGGKRRLFIPWQLAYGTVGRQGPDPAHPLIPPKADLIFDVELVDIGEIPGPPAGHAPVIMKDGKPVVQTPGTSGAPPSPAQPGTATPGATAAAPGTAPGAAAPPTAAAPAATATPAQPAPTPTNPTAPAQPQPK
jgi:peptidylprolyl isomerase